MEKPWRMLITSYIWEPSYQKCAAVTEKKRFEHTVQSTWKSKCSGKRTILHLFKNNVQSNRLSFQSKILEGDADNLQQGSSLLEQISTNKFSASLGSTPSPTMSWRWFRLAMCSDCHSQPCPESNGLPTADERKPKKQKKRKLPFHTDGPITDRLKSRRSSL